jgi:hypothetical protein
MCEPVTKGDHSHSPFVHVAPVPRRERQFLPHFPQFSGSVLKFCKQACMHSATAG